MAIFRRLNAVLAIVLGTLLLAGNIPAQAAATTASISGTITAPTGVNVGSVHVTAYTADANSSYVGFAFVGGDGSYRISNLPAGSYKLYFSGNSGALDQWYSGASSADTATAVTVTDGQALTGLNTALIKGATVSGTISAPAGVDLTSVTAYARTQDGTSQAGSSPVTVNGTYLLTGLPAGSFKIYFSGGNSGAMGQWYPNASSADTATAVTVTTSQDLAGINATLVKGATIGGTITAPPGVNLTSVYVNARTNDAASLYAGYSSVAPDGSYQVKGLPAGSYKLNLSAASSGGVDQWYPNAVTADTATAVSVGTGQDLTGINTTLIKGATISGTITAPAGINLNSVYVYARAGQLYAGYSPVAADGTYRIIGLPAGSYKVDFSTGSSGALEQWYPNASSADTATAVTVASGQDLTGINTTLVKGATISGTITGGSGYTPVTVLDNSGNTVQRGSTDLTGAYSIGGLAQGSYKIAFNRASGYSLSEAQFYQNKPESAGTAAATPLTVSTGQSLPDVNAALVTGGSISGTVTDDTGQPLPQAKIHAYTKDGSLVTRSTQTDAAGKFSVPGLSTGNYLVDVTPPTSRASLGKLYAGNVTTEEASTPVSAKAGADTAIGELSYKATPSPTPVTPAPPTFADGAGSYTIPATTGVDYRVNGTSVTAGTYPGSGTVGVTAQARAGYVLAPGAVASWSHTFTATAAPAFTDVPANSQFATEISWLAAKGISTGWTEADGTKTYRPLQPVNRDAMAAFMYRLAGKPAFTAPVTSPFTDVPTSSQFYKEITWLAGQGISTGWTEADGTKTYRPLQSVNRDAMAAFMYRFNTKFGAL